MREIKFRSWANGEMRQVNGLACTDDSEKMDLVDDEIGGYDAVYDYDELETRVLMQYTGVKDKHGKEIYEGDIVKESELKGRITWVQEHSAFLVFTSEPSGYFYLESDGQLANTEVIGNIYENPELVEDK